MCRPSFRSINWKRSVPHHALCSEPKMTVNASLYTSDPVMSEIVPAIKRVWVRVSPSVGLRV